MTTHPKKESSEKDAYHVTLNLGGDELYAKCTAYDPTADEFLTCESNGCVAIHRSNKDR